MTVTNDHGPGPEPSEFPAEFPAEEFDRSWIAAADQRELSAHGRAVQARPPWQEPDRPARPSLAKRVRFRIYLLFSRPGQRRRN
jgi:hypothetical protein